MSPGHMSEGSLGGYLNRGCLRGRVWSIAVDISHSDDGRTMIGSLIDKPQWADS